MELSHLADKIKDVLIRNSNNREEWINIQLDLCRYMAEAQAKFSTNDEFNKWCEEHQFNLNRFDCSAAVKMGQHIDVAQKVFAATERKSLQHIEREEFRSYLEQMFRVKHPSEYGTKSNENVSDFKGLEEEAPMPNEESKPKTESKPAPNPLDSNDKVRRASIAYDELEATGKPFTHKDLTNRAQVSSTVARKVFTAKATEKAVKETVIKESLTDRWANELTPSQKQKIDNILARERKNLHSHFDDEVSKGIEKWARETGIYLYMKEIENVKMMLKSPSYAVMYKAEYNKILFCLHPDRANSHSTEELAEAFRIFTHYKLKMINDTEERAEAQRKLNSRMPKTLEEMLARRRDKAG